MTRTVGPMVAMPRTVGRTDWDSRTKEQRQKFLHDRFIAGRGRRRDIADVAISSTNETLIRRFVEGIQNVIGPLPGTPEKGVVGTWYALYREFEEIDRPIGIDIANARHAREVCGQWF